MHIAIGNRIGRKKGFSWSRYWATHLAEQEDLNFWAKMNTRSGLTFPDSLGGASANLLLPYYKKITASSYAYVADNGGLDVGVTDLTICGFCNGVGMPAVTNYGIVGKMIDTGSPPNGYYGVRVASGTKKVFFQIKPTGAVKYTSLTASNSIDNYGDFFYRAVIDQTNHLISFFINEVQIGVDVAYTGTFPALDPIYEFYLGAENSTAGAVINSGICAFSDTWVIRRKLTPTEATALMTVRNSLTILSSDVAAHWDCSGSRNLNDLSGNGYHLTVAGEEETAKTIGYSSWGSQQQLNKGYTLYTRDGYKNFYVPYGDDGLPLVAPSIPASYVEGDDFAGSSATGFNLCDSMIELPSDQWDRSNTTYFSAYGRLPNSSTYVISSQYGYYLVASPFAHHISELDNQKQYVMRNRGYAFQAFVKMTNNSIDDRLSGIELFSYSSDRIHATAAKISQYCSEHGYWCDYYFSTLHLCTTRGDKILAFDGTDTLTLSIDGGTTYPYSLQIIGMEDMINYAYIFATGRIVFATHQHIYYSDDNLATYHEYTVLAYDGSPHIVTATNNYRPIIINNYINISGVEIAIFGKYTNSGTDDDLNVWTIEAGENTVRSQYLFGTSPPVVSANHIHGVAYDSYTDYIYVFTGDDTGGDRTNWLRFKYNTTSHAGYGWELLFNGDTLSYYQCVGMIFTESYLYFVCEGQSDTYYGIWRMPKNDMMNESKYERVYVSPDDMVGAVCGIFTNEIITIVNYKPYVVTSIDLSKYVLHNLDIIGANLDFFYTQIHPKNSDNYYRMDTLLKVGEDFNNVHKNRVLMFKIIQRYNS